MKEDLVITFFVWGGVLLTICALFLTAIAWLQDKKNIKQKNMLWKVRLDERDFTMDRISKEIHDNVGQVLGLAQMNIYAIADFAATEQQTLLVRKTNTLIGQVISDLQHLGHSLDGAHIKRLGLSTILKREVEYINASTRIRCTINIIDDKTVVYSEKEVIIFRIAQEAMRNAIKHAKATAINIDLQNTAANFFLSISDDGIGFDMNKISSGGCGLENMYQRAALINGKLSIESTPGQGSRIILAVYNM